MIKLNSLELLLKTVMPRKMTALLRKTEMLPRKTMQELKKPQM